MFDFRKSGQGGTPLVEISISPQPYPTLRLQDSDHTFREEVLSVRSPKIRLHLQAIFKVKLLD